MATNNGINSPLITLAGTLTTIGGNLTATLSGDTNITFPTSGTIATTSMTGRFLGIQYFISSGTYTPSAGAAKALVMCWGGAGSGGGSNSADYQGGGGGGGAFAMSYLSASSQTVTIGAGGAGVSGNVDGNDGTDTSFGSLVIAAHGKKGSAGSTSGGGGGAGGLSSDCTGDFKLSAGYGGSTGNAPQQGQGIGGGSPFMGISTLPQGTGEGLNANPNTGCGGTGTDNAGTSGNGGTGLCLVWEFT